MEKIYETEFKKAVELKNSGKYTEAVEKCREIIENNGAYGPVVGMIASLLYSELNDPKKALPWAQKSVELSPKSETASICLVLCMQQMGLRSEVNKEITRYLKTGSSLDLYKTLFEENNLEKENFI